MGKQILMALSLMLLTTALTAQSSMAAKLIWTGKSGGSVIRWTTLNIEAASADGRKIWSALDLNETGSRKGKEDEEDCTFKRKLKVLSVVGGLLTYSDERSDMCQQWVHGKWYLNTTTIDLKPALPAESQSGKTSAPAVLVETSLEKIFPPDEIYKALMADRVVQKALYDEEQTSNSNPTDLADLIASLGYAKEQADDTATCVYPFDDMLRSFAFHHVEGGKVAVRIFLAESNPLSCGGGYIQLGLLLKIPEGELGEQLRKADRREEGFLMKDAARIGKSEVTTYRWTTGSGYNESE